MEEQLFDIASYRTDEVKEKDGVVCYITTLGEKGPGFRVRFMPNDDQQALDRELSLKYHDELSSADPEVVAARIHKNRVELLTKTCITEAIRFKYPGKEGEWKYTPESGYDLFVQPGYRHILDMLMAFATSSGNYLYTPPSDEEVEKAAETVKTPSSSGKRTRKSK